MDKKVVLFFAYHRTHVFTFQTLFEELRQRGFEVILALYGEHVMKEQIEPELIDSVSKLCEVFILEKEATEKFEGWLLRYFPWYTREYRWGRRAKTIIDSYGPNLQAVVTPLNYATAQIYQFAKCYTRFLALQYEPFIQHIKRKKLKGFEADLICTWGELDTKGIREIGIESEIYVAGSPTVTLADRLKFADLDKGTTWQMLYTTTPLLKDRVLDFAVDLPYSREDYACMKQSAMADLYHVLDSFPQAKLMVKLHPADEGLVERAFIQERPYDRVQLVEHQPDVPIQTYIDQCDILLTLSSTTAFQALVSGKPIIFLNYQNWTGKHDMNYLAYGFALTAINADTLIWAVRKTLADGETQEMLTKNRGRYLREVIRYDSKQAVDNLCKAIVGEKYMINEG